MIKIKIKIIKKKIIKRYDEKNKIQIKWKNNCEKEKENNNKNDEKLNKIK